MRLQRFNCLLLASLLVLATCGVLSAAKASAVNAGTRLQQRPLYPATQGALSTNTNLTGVLPPTKFTIGKPQTVEAVGRCFDHGDTDECANLNSTWSVQQAIYADNPSSSIYVCVCDGAPFDARGLASAYSHVPLFLRQWVTSISSVYASGTSAYTENAHIVFLGPTSSDLTDVFVHESSHAQDQGFSKSQGYLEAIGSDSCVPDDYAQTNNVECYAQDMVVFLYKLWHPYAPPPGTDCMSHQLNALNTSQASGLQAYIQQTVAALVPNNCKINCQYTAKEGDTLMGIAKGCPGESPTSLLPYNPQMNSKNLVAYPGENICFPQHCCSQSRKLLSM